MTRPEKRQKLARQSTAAYAASQPLFDALRNATDRIEEQKVQLNLAQDIVQTLHVKLVGTTSIDDSSRHQQYMDSVVKAWRAAANSYSTVLLTLADLTAAQPDEGKAQREGHAEFSEMASSTSAALKVAREWVLFEDRSLAEDTEGASRPSTTANEVEMEDAGDAEDPAASLGLARAVNNRDREQSPSIALRGRKEAKVNTNGKDTRADVAQERRQKKRQKRAARVGDPLASNAPNGSAQAGVEYEDINGEVDKRLKQKDEQREAAKKSKKRKRASEQSVEGAATTESMTQSKKPKTIKGDTSAAESQKKRGKVDAGEGSDVEKHKKKKKTKA